MFGKVTQEGGLHQEAVAVDFSLSGVRLALSQPVAADRPLQLSLMLPSGDMATPQREAPLDLNARIVWQRDEGGQLRCGAEFIGLTAAQKQRLKEAYIFIKKVLAASVAGVLLHAAPALAATPTPSTAAASAASLSADILASQRAVNAASASLQANLGKALQDVLNIQKNTSGSNSSALALMYQASLAGNVAKLSADGIALKGATEKLNKLVAPIISANSEALRVATAKHQETLKSGNSSAVASAEAAVKRAADKANGYVKDVYGTLVPAVTDKLQGDIGNLTKGVTKLGKSLLSKNNAAIEADKAALASNLNVLMADYVAMTQPKSETPAKPAVQNTVESLVKSLDSLMVKQADGKSVSASSMLSSYLSGLIKSPMAKITTSVIPVKSTTVPKKLKLADGSEIGYMEAAEINPAEALGLFGVNAEAPQDKRVGYAMLTDKEGTTTAIGFGHSAQFSYARALYGSDDLAQLSDQMGVSNLSGIAQGGGMFAYGTRLGDDTRVAVSWSSTTAAIDGTGASLNPGWTNAQASNLAVGVTHNVDDRMTAGINVGLLNEDHGILGNSYDPGSAFSFGETNRTFSLGFSAGLKLGGNSSLLAEAGFATTRGGNASGLIADTSDIKSRSYGMTFMSKHLLKKDDRLTASVVKPLRVVSGQVAVVTESIDANGVASLNKEWVSLVPTGSETNYKLAYDTSLKGKQSLSLQASVRKDVQNIAGNNEVAAGVSWNMKF